MDAQIELRDVEAEDLDRPLERGDAGREPRAAVGLDCGG